MHPNALRAGMTEEKRREIQCAEGTFKEIALRFGVSVTTVRRWRSRGLEQGTGDASHRPKRMKTGALNLAQREALVFLRRLTGWSVRELTRIARMLFNDRVAPSLVHEVLRRAKVSKSSARLQFSEATPRFGRLLDETQSTWVYGWFPSERRLRLWKTESSSSESSVAFELSRPPYPGCLQIGNRKVEAGAAGMETLATALYACPAQHLPWLSLALFRLPEAGAKSDELRTRDWKLSGIRLSVCYELAVANDPVTAS